MVTTAERLVYTAKRVKIEHKAPPHSSGRTFVTSRGTRHLYLNEAVPENGSVDDAVCECCGHGYTECIVNHTAMCGECRLEAAMARAEYLQNEGIPMGVANTDAAEQREKYGCKEPVHAMLRW